MEIFSAFRIFLRRISHFRGCLIHQILAKIIKIYSDFGGHPKCADIRYIQIYMDLIVHTNACIKHTMYYVVYEKQIYNLVMI